MNSVKSMFIRCRVLGIKIRALKRAKETVLEDTASVKGVRYDGAKVTFSNKKDLSDVLIEIQNRSDKIDLQIMSTVHELNELREQVIKMIGMVERGANADVKQAILLDRYINCMTWNETAKSNHYVRETAVRLGADAIREISEKVRNSHTLSH